MNLKEYNKKLKKVPSWDTENFNNYILLNNNIVLNNKYFLVVENWKFYTLENPHYTAFVKSLNTKTITELNHFEFLEIYNIIRELKAYNWFFYINDNKSKTIKRFHFHLVKNKQNWLRQEFNYLY